MFKGGIVPTPENVKTYQQKANKLLHSSSLTKHINCSEKEIIDAIKKTNKIAKGGFGVIAVLLVTQIVAKRMIVPFLSTPLAGFFKNYLEKREHKGERALTPEASENKPQEPQKTEAKTLLL